MKYIYLIKNMEDGYYKIGVATDPKKRIIALQTGNSGELSIRETYLTEHSHKIEKILHRRFSHFKKHGEWFDLSLSDEFTFVETCEKIEKSLKILIESKNAFI